MACTRLPGSRIWASADVNVPPPAPRSAQVATVRGTAPEIKLTASRVIMVASVAASLL
jgi:hypothetical protein